MRVISGSQRKRKLNAPRGEHTRPTTDMVKESVFNIIQTDIYNAKVLDMFCGTGQMGIEALSRGALSCLFIDSDRQSIELTKKNIEVCGFEKQSETVCADSYKYIKTLGGGFDIVFIDPPYEQGVNNAVARACEFDILKPRGIIVCESERGDVMEPTPAPYRLKGEYSYGKTTIRVIVRDE